MSKYHRHFKLIASDIGEIGAEWPDRVGWPFIFERIVKRPYWPPSTPTDDTFILTKFQTDQLRPMEGLDEDSVAEYETVKPENMPPIVLDESFLVIDGSHRLAAAQRRGDKTIWAYVLNRDGFR